MSEITRESMLERVERIQEKQRRIYASRPDFDRGGRVVVHQTGIRDRAGVLKALKWNGVTQSWYADVRMDDDGLECVVPAKYIVREL
jgi:hypothetical protein